MDSPTPSSTSDPAKNNFDFILKEEPKTKRSFGMPNLPKPILIAIVGLVLVIIIAVAGSLTKGGGGSTTKLTKASASATEIVRVSGIAMTGAQNQDTKNIAATTQETLGTQVQEFNAIIQSSSPKKKPVAPVIAQNTNIDAALKTAALNNTYDQTYVTYLKTSLFSYSQALSDAYKTASPASKPALSSAYTSVQTLLTSPQLK